MNKKIEINFSRVIVAVSLFFVFFSFIYATSYINEQNKILLSSPVTTGFLQTSLAVVILGAVILLFKFIDKLGEKGLKITTAILFSLFIVFGSIVCISYNVVQSTDAYRCLDTAVAFSKNDIIIDENIDYYWYFRDFSNNNLFTVVMALFFKLCLKVGITDLLCAAEWLNFALITVAVVIAFLCAKLIGGIKLAVKVLMLIVINPTFYIFTQWIYTCTFSLPIMMGVFYLCLLAKKSEKLKNKIIYIAFCGLLCAFGYLIRPTTIFPLFAFLVIAIVSFKFKKEYFIKYGACLLTFLIVFSVSYMPIKSFSNARFEKTLEYNLPLTHWVLLGLSEEGKVNRNDIFITRSGKDKEGMKKADIKEIKKRLSKFNLASFLDHQRGKLNNTWTDGTNNYFLRVQRIKNENFVTDTLTGHNSLYFTLYAQAFRIFTYLSCIIALILLFRKKHLKMIGIIEALTTVLGGYVFYTVWENKQEYSLPFTLFLLIIAVVGVCGLYNDLPIKKELFKKAPKIMRLDAVLALICVVATAMSLFGMTRFYKVTTIDKTKVVDASINFEKRKCVKVIDFAPSESNPITQTFYTKKKFNSITVFASKSAIPAFPGDLKKNKGQKSEATDYTFELFDKNKKLIVSKMLKRNPGIESCKVKFNLVEPKDKEKFTIKIYSKNEAKTPLYFYETVSYGTDCYEGDLILNGKKVDNDLRVQIVQNKKISITPKPFYFLCFFIILFVGLLTSGVYAKSFLSKRKN